MAEPDDKFVWINTKGTPAGMLMSFGGGHGDPNAFILTVTPEYVARKIQKTLPLNLFLEVQNYCDDHKAELRQAALGFKQAGLTTKELT